MSAGQERAAFAAFLERFARRAVSVEEWNRCAVTHYADAATERARRELVRQTLIGRQCSTCVVPPGLEEVALALREELLAFPPP